MLEPWIANFIGIPFRAHGRTRAGCDCYGLVRLVLAEHFGKTLPAFDDGYDFDDRAEEARLIKEGLPLIGAMLVETPEPGDIVLLRYLGVASHVGVYVGDGRLLHTEEREGYSGLDDLTGPFLRSRIVGYYRC